MIHKILKINIKLNNKTISESGYEIVKSDDFINEDYVILFNLKTHEKYQGCGFAKILLHSIYNYVKNILELNVITLIVYKDNKKALNLYFKEGFDIFIEYDDSYSLIKRL